MKKLHRLIVGSYLPPFIMTFFITLFILVMQFLWKYIDDMVGKGLEWTTIAELLFYASANLVPMALPLAILLSSIMTFGNLGENYELVAMKSSGLSLQRIMLPLIIVTLMTSALAFHFSNNIWPVANLKMARLLYDIRNKKPAFDINEKVFYKGIEGFVIRTEKKDPNGQILYDVSIYDHTQSKGNVKVIHAEKGEMKMSDDKRYLVLTLFNGGSYEDMFDANDRKTTFPFFRTTFDKEIIRFDLSDFSMENTDEELFKDNYQMLNLSQLKSTEDTIRKRLDVRKSQFKKQIKDRVAVFRDSVLIQKPDSVFTVFNNPEGFLSQFGLGNQIRLTETAITLARNAKMFSRSLHNEMDSRQKMITRHQIEWHRKFTLSFACIILFFIGAPLGAIIRKGGLGLPVVVSVLFFLVFHVLSITGEKLAKQGEMDPGKGMWMATLLLTPIGIFLTYKATSDSPILQGEYYQKLWSKIFKEKFKKSKNIQTEQIQNTDENPSDLP